MFTTVFLGLKLSVESGCGTPVSADDGALHDLLLVIGVPLQCFRGQAPR